VLVGVGDGFVGVFVGVEVALTVIDGVGVTFGPLYGLQHASLSANESVILIFKTSLTGNTETPLLFMTVNSP
jgi:hypothetical protein